MVHVDGFALKTETICVSFVISTAAIKTCEFAYKGVEAPRRLTHFAQRDVGLYRGDAGPQKESEMREIAALQNCVQYV